MTERENLKNICPICGEYIDSKDRLAIPIGKRTAHFNCVGNLKRALQEYDDRLKGNY